MNVLMTMDTMPYSSLTGEVGSQFLLVGQEFSDIDLSECRNGRVKKKEKYPDQNENSQDPVGEEKGADR